MSSTPFDAYVTSDEAAEMAGVQRDTWSAYVARNQAPQPAHRIGNKPLWDRAEVQAWIDARPRATN